MEGCKSGWVKPLSEETAQEMIKVLREFRVASELEEISNRLADRIFEDILKDIGLNEDIMEEKKTKKMTKAEAFEYFKGKRVVCDKFNLVDIQRKFFEVGVKWRGGSTEVTEDRGKFLFVDLSGCLTHCNSRAWFDTHEYEEISVDDILSIKIVEDEPLDKWDDFARRVAKIQETLEDDEVCIITKGNFLTMTK